MTRLNLVPLHWGACGLTPDSPIELSAESAGGTLTILHTNDFHSSIDGRPVNGRASGGLARIATTIRDARECGPTLVVDAGDTVFGGGTWWNALGAAPTARLLRAAGYDLAAIGNHDLEHGIAGLLELVQGGYRFVAANLTFEDSLLAERVAPAYVLDAGGIRVGLTGATTPATADLVPAAFLEGMEIHDAVSSLVAVVQALEPLVDTIVVLSHLGFNHGEVSDLNLAPRLRGSKVGTVLGGHTHDALSPAPVIDGIVVCNAGAYGANVNEVRLTRLNASSVEVRTRLIPQDVSVPQDRHFLSIRETEARAFDPLHDQRLPLPPIEPAATRLMPMGPSKDREWALLRAALKSSGLVDAEAIVMVPYLYLLGQLPQTGSVSRAEIFTAYPNIEHLHDVELEGQGLRALIEAQRQLIFYAAALPLHLGDGIELTAGMVDDSRTYRLVVSELVTEGGLGWKLLPEIARGKRSLDICCADLVWQYLSNLSPGATVEDRHRVFETAA